MNNRIELGDITTPEELAQIEKNAFAKSKYKSPMQSILTTDFMEQLHSSGEIERNRLVDLWKERGSKGRPPSKLNTKQVAGILKHHTRVVKLQSNRADNSPPVYVYAQDEGIYTSNRAVINRYLRAIEERLAKRDQNEIYYYLQDTAEEAERTENRYLIPVNNGIFNLKTKKLQEFSPNYVFTTKVDTDYVENPGFPMFKDGWNVDDWLMEIADDDEEVYILLWQVIADSINGNYNRKRSIWLVGDGANGKGTFQDLIRHLVGLSNVASLKIDQFSSNSSGQNFNLAMLEGKTVNIGDDVQSGVYVDDSSNFNSVVTGDPVSVEYKGQMAYIAEFNLTIIQSTNGLPRIKNKTHGTYRRFLIVPFNKQFDAADANYKIKEEYVKNKQVLEYVLYKALYIDFEDFTIPKASQKMLEEYKVSNDPVLEFYEEVFVPIMEEYKLDRIPRQTVFDMYKHFSEKRNYKAYGFNRFMEDHDKLVEDTFYVDQAKWLLRDPIFSYDILPSGTHPQRGQNLRSYRRIE